MTEKCIAFLAMPCTQANTTLHYTTETDFDAHSVYVVVLSVKKNVLHSSMSLTFKAPTPETCKDEYSDLPPLKAVVSRY